MTSTPPEAHHGPSAAIEIRALVLNSLLVTLFLAVLYYLVEYQPVAWLILLREDGLAENMSFVAWALASAMWFWAAWRLGGRARLTLLGMGLAAFLMAGEEISWGQRVFEWNSPSFFMSANRQSETNLHNLVGLSPFYVVLPGMIIGWCVGAWGLVRVTARLRNFAASWAIPVVSPHLWPFFLTAALAFGERFQADLEIAELLLALAICALATDTWARTTALLERISIQSATTIAILILVPALALIFGPRSPPYSNGELRDFVEVQLVLGRYAQAERILAILDPESIEERLEVLFLSALAFNGMGRSNAAVDRARSHIEGALSDSSLTRNTLDAAPTPHRARQLALSLCLLGKRREATLFLRHAQSLDKIRLREPMDPSEEAMTRISLAATLRELGIPKAREEFRRAIAVAPNSNLREKALAYFKAMRRQLEISGCDLKGWADKVPST